MKTNLFLALGIGLFSSLNLSAQYTITNLNLPAQHSGVSIIDIDGDGDLDIAISGEDGTDRNLQVFKNDGNGTFAASSSAFTPLTRTMFDWGDINGDGKLDVIISGFTAAGAAFDSVYTSDGAGNFTQATTMALPQTAPTAGFADLNNDGYTDIYVFGNKNFGHPKIFFNDKLGGFTESDQFDAFNFTDPVVSVVDFDNDKDMDLFVTAGFEDAANTRFSKMFVNNGSGVFTVLDLGLVPKGNGSAVWGDYDGDGYLDLLLNGDGYLGSGEDNDGVYRLYHNNAGASFTADTTFQSYRQNHTGNGGRFVDWDNDGDLDVIVSGWNGTRQATAIYLNNGGIFTEAANNASLPGVSENSIEVGDVDNDGDADLIVSGYSGNDYNGAGSALNANASLLIMNPSTFLNTAPTTPTNLHVTGTQSAINLSWDRATDATTPQNALTYNIFLVDDHGKTFIFPLADTATGRLMLQKTGNVQLNTGWVIHDLPVGNYRWGVQAIDNSFASSSFAEGTFTVVADGTLPVSLTSYDVIAENRKARIEWTTALEQNNDHFEVFRSGDGKNFTKLETIKAKGSGVHQYFVYDDNPSSGVNYYHLVQYDVNGMTKDQGIKTVTFNTPNKASVVTFPNPAYNVIGLRLSNFKGKQLNVTLIDMTGKIIHSEVVAVNNSQGYYTLHLNARPFSGQYILNVQGDNLRESLKVLVK